jgi:hypothetical protein
MPHSKKLSQGMIDKQFKKGQGGRPKGAKNKITLLRDAVLQKAETHVLAEWEEVVKVTLKLAQQGDSTCLRILWDRMAPTIKAQDSTVRKGEMGITIKVEGMPIQKAVIEEGDFKEVE